MKYIEKTKSEHTMFDKWRKAGGWDASDPNHKIFNQKAWDLKQKIKKLLLREQKFICCYCEEQIATENCQIEHLQPKGKPQFAHLKSSYSNLLCSCDYPKSCGHGKDNSTINVFPLQTTCEEVFAYDDNGKIEGKDQNAVKTISILKLNCGRLNAARNDIIDVFLRDMPIDITVSEYDDWIDDYLKPEKQDSGERLRRFWSAVKFIAKKYRPLYT